MSVWEELAQELDLWLATEQVATFWWRDDDLNEPTTAFDRLLDLRDTLDIPLNLAVIPDEVDPRIGDDLAGCTILQHGVLHKSFAKDGQKKSEFPETRSLTECVEDLKQGKARMEELFGDVFFPVFVPPWNRISDPVIKELKTLGFVGLSRYKARVSAQPVAGLAEINTHIDPVFWRGDRSALEDEKILRLCINHLKARRTGFVDKSEPTGFLTHHLIHDEKLWEVTFKLLGFLSSHQAVRWVTLGGAIALIDDFPDDF
ncbi:MAG: polysaccharide deacetylase family protein [Sneathiella sp.]